jgi:hypothetical protein
MVMGNGEGDEEGREVRQEERRRICCKSGHEMNGWTKWE